MHRCSSSEAGGFSWRLWGFARDLYPLRDSSYSAVHPIRVDWRTFAAKEFISFIDCCRAAKENLVFPFLYERIIINHNIMDIEEAKIIIDILKTGSKFYQPPHFEGYEEDVEGIFIEYRPETNSFLLKRYEKEDSDWHIAGYDEKLEMTEDRLIDMFTGKKFNGYTWWSLTEANNYIFDFEQPKKPKRTAAQKIMDSMDIKDYSSLICSHCNSKNVEPTYYSTSINIGGANRYVSLKLHCLRCGEDTSYEWDD